MPGGCGVLNGYRLADWPLMSLAYVLGVGRTELKLRTSTTQPHQLKADRPTHVSVGGTINDGRDMDTRSTEEIEAEIERRIRLESPNDSKVVLQGDRKWLLRNADQLQTDLGELKTDIKTMAEERDELNDEFNSYKDDNEDLQESLDAERRKVALLVSQLRDEAGERVDPCPELASGCQVQGKLSPWGLGKDDPDCWACWQQYLETQGDS